MLYNHLQIYRNYAIQKKWDIPSVGASTILYTILAEPENVLDNLSNIET